MVVPAKWGTQEFGLAAARSHARIGEPPIRRMHTSGSVPARSWSYSLASSDFQRFQASSRAFLFAGVPVGSSPSRMKP